MSDEQPDEETADSSGAGGGAVKRTVRDLTAFGIAAGLVEATGLRALMALGSISVYLMNRNSLEAIGALQDLAAQNEDRLEDLEQLVDEFKREHAIRDEELAGRVSLLQKTIREAGWHAEKELRLALGRLGYRALRGKASVVDTYEVAEALARMTYLDLLLLRETGKFQARKKGPSYTQRGYEEQLVRDHEGIRDIAISRFVGKQHEEFPLDRIRLGFQRGVRIGLFRRVRSHYPSEPGDLRVSDLGLLVLRQTGE